ncbi:MAG TPA: hypothetical protein PLL20_13640 [Phycisphaerae bacterium]|nr:hypothetical protein [Phycisphaerae bacterium]
MANCHWYAGRSMPVASVISPSSVAVTGPDKPVTSNTYGPLPLTDTTVPTERLRSSAETLSTGSLRDTTIRRTTASVLPSVGQVFQTVGQKAVAGGLGGLVMPDLVVIGIDGNCQPHRVARQSIVAKLDKPFRDRAVIACPAPHIERWFLADARAFTSVVGSSPKVRKGKCQRDYYKGVLLQAVVAGGHVPTLGGIEFAR